MSKLDLRADLNTYHLTPAAFAGLLSVGPADVDQWLDGTAPMPGPVAAYLRVLAMLDPEARRAETRQLHRRGGRLPDGIYSVEYKGLAANGVCVLMMTGGHFRGRDTGGGVYHGTCEPIEAGRRYKLDMRLAIPPGVILVTGAAAGPHGADIRIVTDIDQPAPVSRTVVDVGGRPVEIAVTMLGPLPLFG